MPPTSTMFRATFTVGALLATADCAFAQANRVSFSIDWQGPTIAMPDSASAFPITEGDVLVPAGGIPAFGPLPVPSIALSAGFGPAPGIGLFGGLPCAGHAPGTPCIVEVDALSYGREPLTGPNQPLKFKLRFSVDRFARGVPGSNIPPNVFTEMMCGDGASNVFLDVNLGFGPLPPFAAINVGNTGIVDGNGLVSCSGFPYMGIGLVEPATPLFTPVNPGDNLDALATLNVTTANPYPTSGVYFSLDATYVDPLTTIPHTGSALAHGFTCGDVLVSAVAGGPPAVFAPQVLLGLGLTGAEDDLDALILRENGSGVFEPSQIPNDWNGGTTDMLLFSLRRGSAIIGIPDSIFGIPISEGDILTTPLAGSGNPFPGIYIAAENLGLIVNRAGSPGFFADDVDALDIGAAPINDCNGNGVEDAIDIASGVSTDINANGVPDECELLTAVFCLCAPPNPAPCANFYAPGGCVNSTGVGAIMSASGTTSVANDNLVLTTIQMPVNRPGMLVMGPNPSAPAPFWDGLRCFNGPAMRFPVQSTGPGTWTYGPGLSAYSIGNFPPVGWIVPGSTMYFTSWFRDPFGPCSTGANTSNAIQAMFTP